MCNILHLTKLCFGGLFFHSLYAHENINETPRVTVSSYYGNWDNFSQNVKQNFKISATYSVQFAFMRSMTYTECKYGGPLGRRPERVAWKRG